MPRTRFIITIIFFSVVSTIFSAEAGANTVSFSLSPSIVEIHAEPAAEVKIPFIIKNYAQNQQSIVFSYKNFVAGPGEDGSLQFTTSSTDSLLNHIRILDAGSVVTTITLGEKQSKQLVLDILLQENEEAQDHYFSLIGVSKSQQITANSTSKDSQEASSSLDSGIAMNILLSVSKQTNSLGAIQNFSTPEFLQEGPVPFTLEVKNTGGEFIHPTGFILINNIFGQTIGRVDLASVNILAMSSRFIPDKMSQISSIKQLNAFSDKNSLHANWDEKFLIGPYTATVEISLSDTGPVLKKSITFFVFPVEYLLEAIIIIFASIFFIKRVKSHLRSIK